MAYTALILGAKPSSPHYHALSITYSNIALLQCGNGVVEIGEDCDGNDLGNSTCQSIYKFP